jgi:hypothetical protein
MYPRAQRTCETAILLATANGEPERRIELFANNRISISGQPA